MNRYFSEIPVILFFLVQSIVLLSQSDDPARYVNPFIGTGGHGHTFPGATVPFGMVQLSPDTRLEGWDGCSGYHFTDSIIYGFSHTHLSGTGVADYADILIMPSSGFPYLEDYYYKSTFSKENEKAEAGYYSVMLRDKNILAELTASKRAGMHRYTFPANQTSFLVVDLAHRDEVLEARMELISPTEIRGMRRSKSWAEDQVVYFHMILSKPVKEFSFYSNGNWAKRDDNIIEEKDIKAYFAFDTEEGEEVLVKVGISSVDERGAHQNVYTEIPGWDFDSVRIAARDIWNRELQKIKINSDSEEIKETFYTALYHCMIAPNLFTDIDQRYRGMDKQIHPALGRDQYTVFSLWDTYRALHPLLTLIDRRRTTDFIHTFLRQYQQGGLLPVWELSANETYCMIGYHSVPVILDAWVKGIRDFDTELALEAMIHSSTRDHYGLDVYRENCYIPADLEHESVSKTLEYAFDDWCIGKFAGYMGHKEVSREYLKRSLNYQNIYDPQTGFMRPRINGGWKDPFTPGEVDQHYTEANSWQYSFYVPHDVRGLIGLHGSEQAFEAKLDELFETTEPVTGRHQVDITGLIGQYAHGNEPSHHMAYLYNYIGKPWKTQYRVRQILDTQYSTQPDGLSGNEDCGQMSAWYVWSAMGLYPVCPGSDQYMIGSPLIDEAVIEVGNKRTFTIRSLNQSPENLYIQKVTLNDQPLNRSWLRHDEIAKGGELVFDMGPEPDENFGSAFDLRPESRVDIEEFIPVPFFSTSQKSFRDSLTVAIHSPIDRPDYEILYKLVDGKKETDWAVYKNPVVIHNNANLKAKLTNRWGQVSCEIEAKYILQTADYQIDVVSDYSLMYTAGGAKGLIDGLRGSENWRLGGWQGYSGNNFEAIIDLGKKRKIKTVGAGFGQDIKSWIWFPTHIDVYISNDGRDFKLAGSVSHGIRADDYTLRTLDLDVKIGKRARFIRIVAHNRSITPDWHLSPGEPAWLFVDEVWVK